MLHELPRAGSKHPRVREYLRLKRRGSATTGAVAIEGAWSVRRARAVSVPVDVAFVCAELVRREPADAIVTDLLDTGTEVLAVAESVLCRMTDRDGPDGFVAIRVATRVSPRRSDRHRRDLPRGCGGDRARGQPGHARPHRRRRGRVRGDCHGRPDPADAPPRRARASAPRSRSRSSRPTPATS